ncbi:MAG: rRNA maturation RNase YbeY [Rhodospirillaceae bacterium]
MTAARLRTVVRMDTEHWRSGIPKAEILCRKAARSAWSRGRKALDPGHILFKPLTSPVEVSILLSDDDTIKALNKEHLGKDKPTNVLSFPGDLETPDPRSEVLLGDIILAWQTVCSEANRDHKKTDAHMMHLVIHGVLHLLGYDHECEDDATIMERLEIECMAQLGLPDPYTTNSKSND